MPVSRENRLKGPITLFSAIETHQHDAIRKIAFRERRSIADVVREALDALIKTRSAKRRVARGAYALMPLRRRISGSFKAR